MAKLSNFDDGFDENSDVMNVCVSNIDNNYNNNNNNNNNNDDDINWGDCDDKLRCLFDQILMLLFRGVYAKKGIRPIPTLLGDGMSVDLFKLFCLVRDRGGFRSVSEDKLWGLIAEKFGFDYKLCASLKLIYFKYLDELDQWLNRITRDRDRDRVRVSDNGSFECGGNLGLLSLELEKRFRDFNTDEKGLGLGETDVDSGFYDICNRINVAFKESLRLSDGGNGNGNVDDDDNLGYCKDFAGKANVCVVDSSRKRKRDGFAEMLSWMMKLSKNPCNHSIEKSAGCSNGKGNEDRDFCLLALSVKEARLRRRYSYANHEQSSQKKIKMHPSLYDDIPHNSDEGIRSSKRLLSLVKTPPCHCCKSVSVSQCKLESHSIPPSENECHIEEHVNTDLPATKKEVVTVDDDDPPVEKHVLLGQRFQANVPIWTGVISESDSKWLGTQIWVPDFQEENSLTQTEKPGKGRWKFCKCRFSGSMECHRFHIAENRMKLRKKIGLAFYHWKFDRMGEEVSLSWTAADEKKFKHVIRLNTPHLGKLYFPKKKRRDLVSYYFNVYLISRRSYQNRVTPKEINSDDDEEEFGSVSEAFGYNAVKVPRLEPVTCYQNEQVFDFD